MHGNVQAGVMFDCYLKNMIINICFQESNKQLLDELSEARDTVNQLRKQIADQAREDIDLRQMYFKLDQQNQVNIPR